MAQPSVVKMDNNTDVACHKGHDPPRPNTPFQRRYCTSSSYDGTIHRLHQKSARLLRAPPITTEGGGGDEIPVRRPVLQLHLQVDVTDATVPLIQVSEYSPPNEIQVQCVGPASASYSAITHWGGAQPVPLHRA